MDVILTPANILHQRNLGGSLNYVDHLPLGPETALTTQKYNDNDVSTEITTVTIPDAYERNKDYIEPTLYEEQRSLIGKDSNVLRPTIFDQTAIQKINRLNSDRTTLEEYEWDQQSRYNLVSFPFTSAEPFIIPSAPLQVDPTIDPDVV
jgi:hypothetical protein